METKTILDLPVEVLQLVLCDFSTTERARFLCVSSSLWKLGRTSGNEFFRSTRMQIVQPNIRESAASWLEARSDVVKHLILYEYEDAHHCSILQQLPDYSLDSLEWGARHTGTQVVGDLCLPRLRALTLTSCGQSTSGTASALQLEKEFSQLLHLQYLRIEPIWNRVNLLYGCLPSSLTFLHLGPLITTGYLPPAISSSTQLKSLKIGFPGWAECAKLKNLCCLTELELWYARVPGSELSCMTALESLALWSPSAPVLDSHLECLAPLTRLTSLTLISPCFVRSELPPALGDLTTLCRLHISADGIMRAAGLQVLTSLKKLSHLELPDARLPTLPGCFTALAALQMADSGMGRLSFG